MRSGWTAGSPALRARSYGPRSGVGNRYAVAQDRPMPGNDMLSDRQRRFLDAGRVGHLATADRGGVPHVIPVCYAVAGTTVYITIDEKPKRRDVPLKRVRNILENPRFSFVVDRWDEDWAGSAGSCCAAPPKSSTAVPSTTARRHCCASAIRNTGRWRSPNCRCSRCASHARQAGAICRRPEASIRGGARPVRRPVWPGPRYCLARGPGIEVRQAERNQKTDDRYETGVIVVCLEGFRDHRVRDHRQDRAGRHRVRRGHDPRPEITDNDIAEQRRHARNHRDPSPQPKNVQCRTPGLLHARRARQPLGNIRQKDRNHRGHADDPAAEQADADHDRFRDPVEQRPERDRGSAIRIGGSAARPTACGASRRAAPATHSPPCTPPRRRRNPPRSAIARPE